MDDPKGSWAGLLLGSLCLGACASKLQGLHTLMKDPGYIRRHIRDSQSQREDEPLLKTEVNNHPALLSGNWSQLCVTCKIVRPLRSKHCSTCDRCVEQFDHHCPWISNCIGKKNKWDFFMFLILETSAMVITGAATIIRITKDPAAPSSFGAWMSHTATHHPGAIAFLMMDLFLFFGVAVLTVVQASQISRNITTNEMANAMRYGYLRGSGGRFRNPYDHGIRKNCYDFLINGYNEDVELVEQTVPPEGIGMIQMTRNANPSNGENHSHHVNGNGHVCVDVDSTNTRSHGHVHSSKCNDSHKKTDGAPLGLGLGLGRGNVRHNTRSSVSS